MPHVRLAVAPAAPTAAGGVVLDGLLSAITDLVAEVYKKPKGVVAVEVDIKAPNTLSFGGVAGDCAVAQLDGIGVYDEAVHEQFAQGIVKLLSPAVVSEGSRVLVKFAEFEATMWTLNGDSIRRVRERMAAAAK